MMIHEQITTPPTIAANRVVLRPMRRSDEGLIEMYAADSRVASMTRDIPNPVPPGAVEAMIRKASNADRSEDVWVIDGSDAFKAEVMGLVTLRSMDRGQSELFYWVAPAFWNLGVAKESVGALLEANPQNNSDIYAEVFQDNPLSARVLTGHGFEYLGDAEAHSVARNAIVPTWTYIKKLAP